MTFGNRFLLAAVLVAATLAYANHFQNGFHFDDSHSIVDNPSIRSVSNVPRFFSDATTSSVLPANQSYRPIVTTSLAIDYSLARGYNPFWFQLSTFIIFLAQLAGMYVLFLAVLNAVRSDARNRYIAAFATALYGLHPAIAETINYIIQRADVYSTFGIVAGLVVYARFPRLRETNLYLLPVVFALLSKPPAIIFPALLFLYILWFEQPEGAEGRRAALLRTIPSIVVCVIVLLFESVMTPKTFAPSQIPAWSYQITQPYVWLRYFGEFLLPVHLSVDTSLSPFSGLNFQALIGFVFATGLCYVVWLTSRRTELRPIAFGVAWFLIALIPTSAYALSEVENDHRMYLPFVGLALAVTWALALAIEAFLQRNVDARVRPAITALALIVLVAYAVGTHQRNQVWHSDESLWYDATRKDPGNGRGLMNYGLTQMAVGRYDVALDYFQRAALITPTYGLVEINMGIATAALNRNVEAERHFQRAIQLAPSEAQAYAFYGRWLGTNARGAEAVLQLQKALALSPSMISAREMLLDVELADGDIAAAHQTAAAILVLDSNNAAAKRLFAESPERTAAYWINVSLKRCREHRYPSCIAAAHEALQRDPHSSIAYHDAAAGYAGLDMWAEAVRNEQMALRINPRFTIAAHDRDYYLQRQKQAPAAGSAEAFLETSYRLNQAGDYRKSIDAARVALRLRPKYAEAYNNIAADYEALGDWDAAIAAAGQALKIKPDYPLARNNLTWSLAKKASR